MADTENPNPGTAPTDGGQTDSEISTDAPSDAGLPVEDPGPIDIETVLRGFDPGTIETERIIGSESVADESVQLSDTNGHNAGDG